MDMGRTSWLEARATIKRLLSETEGVLRDSPELRRLCIHSRSDVQMHLPARIGDYTDFYAARSHAENMGTWSSKVPSLRIFQLCHFTLTFTRVHLPRGKVTSGRLVETAHWIPWEIFFYYTVWNSYPSTLGTNQRPRRPHREQFLPLR